MTHIETISLRNLLPLVFKGMEVSDKIQRSQVWMVPELTLRRGCRTCVQAESGGGKSSLLSFVYGNRMDYQGDILFDGHPTRDYTTDRWCQLRTNNIALLPQEMRLFPELTVMQNLHLKNSLTNHKSEKQLLDLLHRMGIGAKADDLVGTLSIGQQQRVAIIRSICQPFDFIFLVEPVSHLDRANNLLVAQIIHEEALAQGAGVVTTSVGNPLLLEGAECIAL